MQIWLQLMMKEMNAKAMEQMMGENERIIDVKLVGMGSQLSVSQLPGTSHGILVDLGAPSLQTRSYNATTIPEVVKGLRKPRLLLDRTHESEDE
ncbi:hypothetical protein R1flu_009539 [Riccia fluitans]|uniref:Uncharacterized protein n=1 Tax=Riccia fluitans TaxID=41844 RepID=A0ABD1Z2E5_9MARC